mmetsp:Transcript_16734/g.50002  ORF Transcript_16734/g.50002 Transcript_16734/m.50002 type:complete len:383 (-) Transcript_16734:722-1870(-)
MTSTADASGLAGETASGGPESKALGGAFRAGKHGVQRPQITVLGAGVIGLSTAVMLQEAYPHGSVTVAANGFQSATTSHGAAGLWKPFKLGAEQDPSLIDRWGSATYQYLQRLHAGPDAVAAGVICTPAYLLYTGGSPEHTAPDEPPSYASSVSHMRRLSHAELGSFAQPYQGGYCFTTYICEGGRYLPWLTRRFKQAGGRVVTANPKTPDELEACLDEGNPARLDCDVLVNCTGLHGARDLFKDQSVYPIRGQVVRVKAPWIKCYYNVNGESYIIPNIDTVVLGGTSTYTYEPKEADPADRQRILNNVCAHLPSLRQAEVVEDWVGHRPGRPSVRQELCTWRGRPTVHSYGHGGAGITLHWGVAQDNLALVQQALGLRSAL